MNMVIPDEGKVAWLTDMFSLNTRESLVCKLFQNNETVDDLSTAGDFTIATFTGYANVTIARNAWGTPVISGSSGQVDANTAPVFSCTGGSAQTVYGWILVGNTSGLVYAGQNFDTPRVMSSGATETLDPFRFKLKTFS